MEMEHHDDEGLELSALDFLGSIRPASAVRKEVAGAIHRVEDDADVWMGHSHFMNQGHSDSVRCLATDAAVQHIVTGGDDGTARVWRYDGDHSFAYHFCLKICHGDSAVTAVAITPRGDVIFTGTDHGDLFVLGNFNVDHSDGALESHLGLHEGAISDLCVVSPPSSEDTGGAVILASAGTDGRVRVHDIHTKLPPFELCRRCCLQHAGEVLRVRNVTVKSLEGRVDFATCAADATYLWNLKGELLVKLSETRISDTPQSWGKKLGKHTTGFSITSDGVFGFDEAAHGERADETLLVACGDGLVNVWQLDGIDAEVEVRGGASPPPLAQYEWGDVLDVELAPSNHQICEMRHEGSSMSSRVCIWSLIPPEGNDERCIAPMGEPVQLTPEDLTTPGHETIEAAVLHNTRATVIRMVFDPEDGAALVSGCANGDVAVWDLEGRDAGEQLAALRSLNFHELLLPVVMIGISFVQVISFAFGPSIPWSAELGSTSHYMYAMSIADVRLSFSFDKQKVFWPQMLFVLALMCAFSIFAFFDVPARLRRRVFILEDYPLRQIPVRVFKNVSYMLMWCCSSFLVVPVSRVCAVAFDCVHTSDGPAFLVAAPEVQCYVGWHLQLVRVLPVVYGLFFMMLVPYAVVAGDALYVQPHELFSWSSWRANAERRATLVHMGPMHPRGHHVFWTSLVELLAKISLPVIAVETTSMPVAQMALTTAVGATWLLATLVWPPLVDESFNAVVVGMRVFTVVAMLCGLLTAVLDDPDRKEPLALFSASSVLVIFATLLRACRAPKIRDHLHVQVFAASRANPMAEDPEGRADRCADVPSAEAPRQQSLDDGDETARCSAHPEAEGSWIDEFTPLLSCCSCMPHDQRFKDSCRGGPSRRVAAFGGGTTRN